MRQWALGLVGFAFLSGCVDVQTDLGDAICQPTLPDFRAFPLGVGAQGSSENPTKGFNNLDPRQPWDALFFVKDLHFDLAQVPAGWTPELLPATPDGTGPLRIARLTPTSQPEAGSLGYHYWEVPDSCLGENRSHQEGNIGPVRAGEIAAAGKGVHVYTAGFWENGTLFYTNIPQLNEIGSWPRAGWFEKDMSGPLAVYVYDQSPQERSPVWGTRGVGAGPAYLSLPPTWYYSPTIPGFNEALKGLSSGTTRVVWMEPEKAYTNERAKAANHPLYGDALVFFIKIVDVVDIPCPDVPGQSNVNVGGRDVLTDPCDAPPG